MPTKRYSHSCGLVTGPDIVVAGGQYSGTLDSVDIYNVNTDSWRVGTEIIRVIHSNFFLRTKTFATAKGLPKPMRNSAVVPYEDTFLLVGGYNGNYLADVFQYNPNDDEWAKLTTELKIPRHSHIAVLVQQSLFHEC